MNEKHCTDLLAGYALEILDGEDALTAEEHLRLCTECREEMEALRETLHLCLGHANPLVVPNPLVRTQILAQFALESGPAGVQPGAASLSPGPPKDPDVPAPILPLPAVLPLTMSSGHAMRQRLLWILGGGALPAVAAVLLGILFLHTQNQLNDQRNNALSAAISSPHATMPLQGIAVSQGMTGEVLMQHQSGSGVLIVSGIRQVPGGMSYTCWIHKHGQWMNGGTLQPDASGIAMVSLSGSTSLSNADTVAVTMEHSTHASAPSKPMLLMSRI